MEEQINKTKSGITFALEIWPHGRTRQKSSTPHKLETASYAAFVHPLQESRSGITCDVHFEVHPVNESRVNQYIEKKRITTTEHAVYKRWRMAATALRIDFSSMRIGRIRVLTA